MSIKIPKPDQLTKAEAKSIRNQFLAKVWPREGTIVKHSDREYHVTLSGSYRRIPRIEPTNV